MFNSGDVVRLNSGGKEMVVAQVNGPTVLLVWQQADGYGQLSINQVCVYLVRKHSDSHSALRCDE